MHPSFSQVFMRKIISAGIATFLFCLILSWLEPELFQLQSNLSFGARFHEALSIVFVYMMYAGPVIYVYGTITSLISERIAQAISPKRWVQLTVSAVFHCGFGLVLHYISLLAAVLFFLADAVLSFIRKKPLTHGLTAASVLLPLGLWIASLIYIRITG